MGGSVGHTFPPFFPHPHFWGVLGDNGPGEGVPSGKFSGESHGDVGFLKKIFLTVTKRRKPLENGQLFMGGPSVLRAGT